MEVSNIVYCDHGSSFIMLSDSDNNKTLEYPLSGTSNEVNFHSQDCLQGEFLYDKNTQII